MSTTGSVYPVDGAAYYGLTATKTATQGQSKLDMAAFLNLLCVQLENQNPLEPMNDTEFYAQLAQLGTVQGIDALKESMGDTQAMSLMGKVVTAVRPTSSDASDQTGLITGTVKSLIIKDGVRYLGVQDTDGSIVEVKMSSVQSVEPTLDVSSAAALIGKKVTGAYNQGTDDLPNYVAVTGTVTSVFAEDGTVKLTLKDSSNKSYDIRYDTVSNIES